jgi:peptidoglycan/xylan/chitin deacetylase (PgdA/CDA1 family)
VKHVRGTPSRTVRAVALLAGLSLLGVTSACTHPGPTEPRPAPSPSHHAKAAPAHARVMNPFLLRVSTFPPAPQPKPVQLPSSADGLAPFFDRLPTTQRVAFLTIDDGWTQSPDAIALMQAANIPFTMFLIAPVAAHSPKFFRQLVATGGSVGDHTITHPSLRGRSYDFQHHEMCDSASTLTRTFGHRPQLFRPPYGNYDTTTLRVAHDCGYTAVLNWSETVIGGTLQYQTADHTIHPGDILLLHFWPTLVADVLAALAAIRAAGLTPAVLGDYLPAPGGAPLP